MRTIEQLVNRKKSLIENSEITTQERKAILAEIARHEKTVPNCKPWENARFIWWKRLDSLQRALDLH